jgi:hypothetical protein
MSDYKEAPRYDASLFRIGKLITPVSNAYRMNMNDGRVTSAVLELDVKPGDEICASLTGIVCESCQLKSQEFCSGLSLTGIKRRENDGVSSYRADLSSAESMLIPSMAHGWVQN